MSGLGALWGFIKSKLGSAAFRDVGTSAGNVVALNGSAQLPAVDGSLLTGVGSGWTHDVTSSAELAAALAVPGARIRATANFTVNSSLAISAGYYVLGRDDLAVQITFGASGQLTAAAACGIEFYDPFWAKGDTPFLVAGGSFGAMFQATANLMLIGNLSIQVNTSGASLGCAFDFNGLRIRSGVYVQLSTLAGWADSFIFDGTSSANAYLYSQCAGWGRALFRGLFKPFNSGASIASDYTALLYNPGNPTAPHYGPITFTEHSQNPAVCLQGNNGSRVILDSAMSTDASYVPRVGLFGGAECRGGTFHPRYTDTSDAALVVFRGCRLLAPTFESGSDSHLHEACEFAEAFTFPSDSKPVIRSCFNTAALVFQSGSKPRLEAHTIGNGTSITLDSGAGARVSQLRLAGSGALTNNDPLSIVTDSENPASDTTPSTARFGSATLDARLPHLVAYWRGESDGEPSIAPLRRNAGQMAIASTSNASISSGLYISGTTGLFRAGLQATMGNRKGWTLAFFWKPVATTDSAEKNICFATTESGTQLIINGLTTNNIGVHYGSYGATTITTTAGNLFSTSADRLVCVTWDGTTLRVRVNGVEVGTAVADCFYLDPIIYIQFGTSGGDAKTGRVNDVQVWDRALTNAEMDELLTNTLQSGVA